MFYVADKQAVQNTILTLQSGSNIPLLADLIPSDLTFNYVRRLKRITVLHHPILCT